MAGGGGTLHIPDIPGCVPWMTDTCSWGGGLYQSSGGTGTSPVL